MCVHAISKNNKTQERSLEAQSQVLPAIINAGWISGNLSFLLRVGGSEEGGGKPNISTSLSYLMQTDPFQSYMTLTIHVRDGGMVLCVL